MCATHVDAACISSQRNKDLATHTGAPEDGSEVLVCLWANFTRRNGGPEFPAYCPSGKHCCLVQEDYWDDDPAEYPSERLFS